MGAVSICFNPLQLLLLYPVVGLCSQVIVYIQQSPSSLHLQQEQQRAPAATEVAKSAPGSV